MSGARTPTRTRATAVIVAIAAAGFTGLVVGVRQFDVAYHSPPMHVAIETVAAVIGVVTAYLLVGRYRLSARLADLLLALSMLALAVGSLFFSVLPAALSGKDVTRFSTWAPIMSGLVGAVGLTVAAFSHRQAPLRWRTVTVAAFSFALVIAAIVAATDLLEERLPVAVPPSLSPVRGGRELVTGQPAVLAIQLATMLLFVVASIGFLRRDERSDDALMRTFSIAAVVGAFSAFNYFLFPSLYSQWIYAGDILRFSFYVILLVGAARELSGYWRGLAQTAALEERRRIARDLHDGLAQELAFIVSRSQLLSSDRLGRELSSAAERAVEESRRAIDALTRPLEEPLDQALGRTAERVAARFGLHLSFDFEGGLDVPPATRDALQRIVGEAVTNAARHGAAQQVTVKLARPNGTIRLQVVDDGCGFEPSSSAAPSGFGLVAMRERAASVGGDFRVSSQVGAGTLVEVLLHE
jgi:signal transduction histidine kinase